MKKGLLVLIIVCAFVVISCEAEVGEPIGKEPLEGKLIILQAYGNGDTTDDKSPKGVSHSFVELYNTSDTEISLDGVYLHFADGIRDTEAIGDYQWDQISLDGKTIPAKASFLLLGAKHSDLAQTNYIIEDGFGDINDPMFILSRRAFKVALIKTEKEINVQNPFDTDGKGSKFEGYIDMVGTANEYEVKDMIFGFETEPARNSASEAIRRKSLLDTNNNAEDFEGIRYADITNELLEVRKPKNSSETKNGWDPFKAPKFITSEKLLLLQVYGSGDDAKGAISHSFVELYNNTDEEIDLSNYSIHHAIGPVERDEQTDEEAMKWNKINLSGTVPSKHSFLIRGTETTTSGMNLTIERADLDKDFILSNRTFKVVLMENQDEITAENPFVEDHGEPIAGYVDMIGARNDKKDEIDAYEGDYVDGISKQKSARRITLTDHDDNAIDFEIVDYRIDKGMTSEKLELYRPRSLEDGAWDPVI